MDINNLRSNISIGFIRFNLRWQWGKTMKKNAISDVSLLEWEQILEVMDFKKWEVAYLVKSNGKWELLGAPYFGETVIKITKDEVRQHIRNFRSKESNRV